nr:hypothetical protein [Tanacetum cinerariifolium]
MYSTFSSKRKEVNPTSSCNNDDHPVIKPWRSDLKGLAKEAIRRAPKETTLQAKPSKKSRFTTKNLDNLPKQRPVSNADFYNKAFTFTKMQKDVRNLVASSFTARIRDYDMPDGLKVPTNLKIYDRMSDPDDHLTVFMGTINVHKLPKPGTTTKKVVAPKAGNNVLMINEGRSLPHYQENRLRHNTDISFTSDDPVPDYCSGDDPLFIKAGIGGSIIHHIYVDEGSSAEIILISLQCDIGWPGMRQLGAFASTIQQMEQYYNSKVHHRYLKVIHTRIWIKTNKKEVFFSFVYAHNHYIHRRALWQNLGMHYVYIRKRPRCLLGDFNSAISLDDMLLSSSTIDISIREFKECGHEIFQPYRISDHSPAMLCLPSTVSSKPRPFKFTNILVHNTRFKEVVLNGWNKCVIDFHMFKRDLDRDPFNSVLRDEEALYVQAFSDAVLLEERFLKQKAKVDWLRDGDANAAYFYKSVKTRDSRSRIDVVMNSEGVIYENEKVAEALVTHYEMFLGQHGTVIPLCDSNLFQNRLDDVAAIEMIREVSDQEIKDAIFSMRNDKSPGPDGYTAAFFKEAWDIISKDIMLAIREFFVNGKLLKELNHTIIALIPKVSSPAWVNDYRPISCCNVLFKCISKIIANRIKESLKMLVSSNQSAFVPGRNITDNILLAQELMHNYHLDRGPPRCAFKVDIQKAYDTVDWNFLKDILLGFGFHDRLVGWIMECVTSTSFSININGSLHGYFKGKRGLRQGNPLSPYLFTLVMNILTLMIRRRVQSSDSFMYHRYCSKLEIVNLCFADDLFLFAHRDTGSTKVIMEALDEFKNVSGLTPSLPKSKAYFCNVLNHVKLSILQILPFEEDRLPVEYLGVPLVSSGLIIRDCKELIEKVQNRVDNWKNKLLSIAGRLQLIQSVVGSLHVFWASDFVLPAQVLLDIEQIMRGFLWSHSSSRKGQAKVAWDVVCLPRKEGGLGIRRLSFF